MTKKRHCDLCDKVFERTYKPGPTNKARDGRGSWRVAASFRRRLAAFLLGAPLVLKVWSTSTGWDAWNKYDICSACAGEIRDEIEERRSD